MLHAKELGVGVVAMGGAAGSGVGVERERDPARAKTETLRETMGYALWSRETRVWEGNNVLNHRIERWTAGIN